MDPVLIILSKIIRYKGLLVSRCMRRLLTPNGIEGPSMQVRNHKIRRFIRESMHAEVTHA
jgi:hypothetical protein